MTDVQVDVEALVGQLTAAAGEGGSEPLLRTHEVCQRTGASYRQVDYWTRAGWVTPTAIAGAPEADASAPGSGYARLYDARQVEKVRMMATLVEIGLTPALAARVAGELAGAGIALLTDDLAVVARPD